MLAHMLPCIICATPYPLHDYKASALICDTCLAAGHRMKRCRGCGGYKPDTEFYLKRDPRKPPNTRMAKCKNCVLARLQAQRRKLGIPTSFEWIAEQKSKAAEIKFERNERRRLARASARQALAVSEGCRDYADLLARRRILHSARTRAKQKGWPFTLTPADVPIPEKCPVLGIVLKHGTSANYDASPTIDRLDSSRGYVPSNVCVISCRANHLKNNSTVAEIEAVLAYMRKYQLTQCD